MGFVGFHIWLIIVNRTTNGMSKLDGFKERYWRFGLKDEQEEFVKDIMDIHSSRSGHVIWEPKIKNIQFNLNYPDIKKWFHIIISS